jgi:hypothetical protein
VDLSEQDDEINRTLKIITGALHQAKIEISIDNLCIALLHVAAKAMNQVTSDKHEIRLALVNMVMFVTDSSNLEPIKMGNANSN